ncbi:efflux RND transporter periplasmic adaptor subunit [Chromobacterium piscinae]|uniref:Efflux RND transporter periplasmic adaptor subunit n=1 Tax=Chromobacterium piscinae TaxID=686831 RepID=A0ABV0HC78_9NEIS|nr:efflux RND transporter periplasmic adaptor subunit [Chromobacterium piscinae]MBX9296151.1 efflux RND transporter periplasmic adaptor subunit [Chromobacterium vaccinii]MBX9355311.1 efflux RND transporter periplasmic adaptor subunit [Chromobacterium vaccinii]MCD5330436.1 efflux RND transporter periplasmic adaptor subunit [Chromobacterium piscinae]NHQ83675.1 efflux RND transporter periplasmic adaptor subunit [Chromobacterium vaccinii]
MRLAWVVMAMSMAAQAAPSATAADGRIRVQLMSRHAVTLSSEIPAKISAMPVVEGGGFRRGQPLVEFDCSSYRAQLRKAQASLEAASQLLKVNNQLAKYNSVGTLELTQAQGKAKEAAADASYAQTLVSKCSIAAPFDGRVAKRSAAVHQYVNPGNPILDIVDSDSLELRMLVPSKWLATLKPGSRFTVAVDELGASFPARIERLGAQIDPVSQTILAIGVIDGKAANLLPGMSGWASFK